MQQQFSSGHACCLLLLLKSAVIAVLRHASAVGIKLCNLPAGDHPIYITLQWQSWLLLATPSAVDSCAPSEAAALVWTTTRGLAGLR